VVKNVAGFDLTKLQVGGFGAFGVLAQLHLRLRAVPEQRLTLLARGTRDALTRQARSLAEAQVELCSPALAAEAEWVLALELSGTEPAVAAEAARVASQSEVAWSRLDSGAAATFWNHAARGHLQAPVTLRLGVFPDGLDELIDLLEQRLEPGLLSAGPGRGLLRWSGEAGAEALRTVRHLAAQREIPLTLERAPWPLRAALGHFGAYREGVGNLVSRLRGTFDAAGTFAVALEGEHE
jgi:glycolate oxidase FAD binding subunit